MRQVYGEYSAASYGASKDLNSNDLNPSDLNPSDVSTKKLSDKSLRYVAKLILLIGIAAIAVGCAGTPIETSDTPKTYRVGFLAGVDTFNIAMDGFREGMAELGYIEGENISYDFQSANGDREQMKLFAEQFVADEVDLIFTTTTGAAQEARAATDVDTTDTADITATQIPVVFTVVSNPIGSNVVADLRQPGGNVTGATRSLSGLISKRIAFLQEIMPDINGVWIPYEEGYANSPLTLNAIHEVADPLDIAVIESPINSLDALQAEIERFSALDTLDFGAIAISPDPTVQSEDAMAALMAFAQEHDLPVVANTPAQVREGALMTYSDDTFQSGRLAASLADKILKGTKPGVIPIAFIEPNLYLNYKTAQMLGLALDENLLAQANEIIR